MIHKLKIKLKSSMVTTSIMVMLSLHSHSPSCLLLSFMFIVVFWVWKFVIRGVFHFQTEGLLKSILWQFFNLPVFLMELNRLRFEGFSRFNHIESQVSMGLQSVPAVAFQEGKEPHFCGKWLSVGKFTDKSVFPLFKNNLYYKRITYWKWMRLVP